MLDHAGEESGRIASPAASGWRSSLRRSTSAGCTAGRAARPQKPVARFDRGTDCWREQHRHAFGLPLVPSGDEARGILKYLCIGGAAGKSFLLGRRSALILHLAAVEPHGVGFRRSEAVVVKSN